MARTYTMHRREECGARVSWGTQTVKGIQYVLATITRGGRRWRFTGRTKGSIQERVREKLVELANEGTSAKEMSEEARGDALKAAAMLVEGETLADAVRELVECRRLLGLVDADGKLSRGDVSGLRGAVKLAVAEFAEARADMGGRASMREAAKFWARHHPDGTTVTFGQLAADFMLDQERQGNRPAHVRTLRQRLETMKKAWGKERSVADFTTEEVMAFVHGRKGLSVRSRNSWLVTVKSVFKFAADQYGLETNPAAKLKKGKVAEALPEFVAVNDVEKLLRAAEKVAERTGWEWVPAATALLFFTGVRPVELAGQYGLPRVIEEVGEDGSVVRRKVRGGVRGGLDWKDVLATRKKPFVRLTAEVTKTTQARNIPMSKNLLAWIERYGGQGEGRVVPNPQSWKRARAEVERIAGVKWGQDWARHSFASFHLAKHNDRNALEMAMGHGKTSTQLEKAYDGRAEPEDAEKFWNIMPTSEEGER